MHEGAKVNHLTYIGDASVGAKANIGAGTITCNYDGFAKHRTEIGEGAFIEVRHRAIAAANLTARNEETTAGASLWGLAFQIQGEHLQLALDVDNLMNTAWLDHVSAYRTLGLVTQGRWASLRVTLDVTRETAHP